MESKRVIKNVWSGRIRSRATSCRRGERASAFVRAEKDALDVRLFSWDAPREPSSCIVSIIVMIIVLISNNNDSVIIIIIIIIVIIIILINQLIMYL